MPAEHGATLQARAQMAAEKARLAGERDKKKAALEARLAAKKAKLVRLLFFSFVPKLL